MRVYLMSPPGPDWCLRGKANFRSRVAPEVNAKPAIREWLALADAIEARGGRVICLPPPENTTLTGLPYAAEAGQIVERDGRLHFLLPNMRAPHRQGERELWRKVAEDLGMKPVTIDGVWEAQGDVASFRDRTLLFHGGRTDLAGARNASRWFENPLLLQIREPAFHGNMAALPLGDVDRLLVCPSVFVPGEIEKLVDTFGKDALLELSDEEIRHYSTNGLPIGRDWLIPHLVPERVKALVGGLGMTLVELPLVELCEKAGGASRCLVSEADLGERRLRIPEQYDYRLQRAAISLTAAP